MKGDDPKFVDKVAQFWHAIAARYADRNPDYVFYEIMNEPQASAFAGVGPGWWQPVQESLRDVPYPSSPRLVQNAAAEAVDLEARKAIQRYGNARWDKARIRSRIALAASWAARYHVPILCAEFGVYKKFAPMADRYRWIDDTRTVLEQLHIGWSMWDLDGGFGLVSYKYPAAQSGVDIDSRGLAALGLRSVAILGVPSSIDDFDHSRSARLTLPVRWMGNLWTREAHAGSVSLDPLSAGTTGSATIHIVHTGCCGNHQRSYE